MVSELTNPFYAVPITCQGCATKENYSSGASYTPATRVILDRKNSSRYREWLTDQQRVPVSEGEPGGPDVPSGLDG